MIIFNAHFDGERLCPESPIDLPQNVRLQVTVVPSGDDIGRDKPAAKQDPAEQPQGFLEEIIGTYGLIEGPPDWSAELDHYLYGTPKRGDRPAN